MEEFPRDLDKNVKIPPGETIGVNSVKDVQRFTVSEKKVVVPKEYRFQGIS